MSAPSIPNLNTLRRGGPRSRGRGRGRGSDTPPAAQDEPPPTDEGLKKDRIIQNTDQDASVSRMSAVDLGYLEDPFARGFTGGEPARRYPIINRGRWFRWYMTFTYWTTILNKDHRDVCQNSGH